MKRNTKKGQSHKEVLRFCGFALPSTFIWTTVVLIPFIYGIIITFTDWNGLAQNLHFVGLENYRAVLSDASFQDSFFKTVKYVFFTVIGSNLVGLLLALALTDGIKWQKIFRTGFFTPNVIGGIILGYIWNFIFSYALTGLGKQFGISWLSKSWLTSPNTALAALIIVSIWQLSGYLMVIYIAGLTNVPSELIEAAKIDGANDQQVIRNVKIPLIRNSVTICIFLAIARTFMSFDINLSLTSGGPYKSTELIAYKIYQTAFGSMKFGAGQAEAVVLFLIVATVSLLQVYFTRRGGEH